jgi:8-oxo-dGTP pyrophosphatase MutT (NUDIX family)
MGRVPGLMRVLERKRKVKSHRFEIWGAKISTKKGPVHYEYAAFSDGLEDAVIIVPMDGAGNVYLVEEYSLAMDEMSLHPPKGGAKKGKSLLQAAEEELGEEAGLEGDLVKVGVVKRMPGYFKLRQHIYLATNVKKMKTPPEGDELEKLKVQKMPFKKAIGMCVSGKIDEEDAISALFLVREFLDKKR